MKKKLFAFMTAVCCVAGGAGSMSVSARQQARVVFDSVVGENDTAYCLHNGCLIDKEAYKAYFGEELVLNKNHLVAVYTFNPPKTGEYYTMDDSFEIYELESTEEAVLNNRKELIVTETHDNLVVLSEFGVKHTGEIWRTPYDEKLYDYYCNYEELGFEVDIVKPWELQEGDIISCCTAVRSGTVNGSGLEGVVIYEYQRVDKEKYIADYLELMKDYVLLDDEMYRDTPWIVEDDDITESCTSGDVTGDGEIDVRDMILLNQAIFGKVSLTEAQLKAVDFNGDGMPDAEDSLRLMKYIVGLIDSLD